MAPNDIFKAAFEAAPIGILLVNAQGCVVEANAEACRMFGYPAEELDGRSIEILVPQPLQSAHRTYRGGFVANPQTRSMGADRELLGCRPDGSQFPIEVGLNPFLADSGLVTIATVVDISARRQHEEEFRVAIESSPIGAVVVDDSGHIVTVNSLAGTIFGYASGELIGQPVELLVPHRHRSEHVTYRAAFLDDPRARMMGSGHELVGRRKDGTEFPMEIGLNPIKTAAGVITIASVADITVRREMEDELRAARRIADSANLAKSQFLAGMSHELRTPLNEMLGMAELLLAGKPSAEQRAQLETIIGSGRALTATLQALLDVAALDSTGRERTPVPTRLAPLIDDAIRPLQDSARRKGLLLQVETEADLPLVEVDPDPLRQAIALLVDNAIKFCDRGSVTVRLHGVRDGHRALSTTIAVEDTGIGIQPDDHRRIFESFERADASSTRRFGGGGLGLTICSRLVTNLGGALTVDSEPGRGSTFTIALNLPQSPAGAREDASSRARVLLAHGNVLVQRAISNLTVEHGLRLVFATTGRDAIDALAVEPCDLVVADYQLTDMNAVELSRRIRMEEVTTGHRSRIVVLADRWELDDAQLEATDIDVRCEAFTIDQLRKVLGAMLDAAAQ